MMATRSTLSVAALVAATGFHGASGSEVQANPIRKVVTLLQNMEKKVKAEGEKDEELYKKYMCYCKTSSSTLEASISAAGNKVPQLESQIKEAEGSKTQMESDLVSHRSDRSEAKNTMEKASEIRTKEEAAYSKEKAELEANIGALAKAISAVDKGMAGGFLQTSAASVVKNLMLNFDKVADYDRQEVLSFLSGSDSNGYSPQSGEISGVLKQIKDEMSASLADATKTEEGAVKTYGELMAAKEKEVAALTTSIEEKSIRVGEIAVEIATMKNDLSDTEAALLEDKQFLADMDKNCATKKDEYEVVKKTRSEELVALAETIKILNDDEALELFKKTLPSAASSSFIQSESKSAIAQAKALAMLRKSNAAVLGNGDRKQMEYILLALKGKKVGFEKVIKMIDEMVGTLKQEQEDDSNKKEYCNVQFDALDDKKKSLETAMSDAEKAIADAEETISTTKGEIEALEDSIKALDKQVTEATEQRMKENAAYKENMAANSAAKELIEFAKNRLQKFYNPKLYVPPEQPELSEEDRATLAAGGTLAPTPAPGGIAGTGITVFAEVHEHADSDVAPPPPPQAVSAYKKKSEDSAGVISMMDLLVKDLDKEMTASEVEEKDSQADFETSMKEAAKQRATSSKALVDKNSAKAEAESNLLAHTDAYKSSRGQLLATVQVIGDLHNECDWLLQYFDVRKEARDGEIESLGKAKAVLSGADFA